MLELKWDGDRFTVVDGDDRAWVPRECTVIMAASRGGHSGLVKEPA